MVNGQTWRPPWVRDRFDALVTLHDELVVFAASGEINAHRQRGGIDDEPLLRTTAVLPFLAESSLSESAEQLLRGAGDLVHSGWSPLQLQISANERHRHPQGQLPTSLSCHPDTLRETRCVA